MISRNKKLQIIKIIRSILDSKSVNHWKDLSEDKLLFQWFLTSRNSDGLRLSDDGKKAFYLAEIAHYEFPVELLNVFPAWSNFNFMLCKKLHCPFHISVDGRPNSRNATIKIYDSKVAMLITLYGGINEYLESITAN